MSLAILLVASLAAVGRCNEIWFGTAPWCNAKPSDCGLFDLNYVRNSDTGDGSYCITGKKVLCRAKSLSRSALRTEPNTLHVVTQNLFERPFIVTHDGQVERTCHVSRALLNQLPKTDVIIFEEAFRGGCWPDSGVSLRSLLRLHGFPFVTATVGENVKSLIDAKAALNGGVFIASRHPILKTDSMTFMLSYHTDFLARKGVMYAKISKDGKPYHIFGTHMQAQAGKIYDDIRVSQAHEIRSFVRRQEIPASEPVIIGGDFNCDSINHPSHVRDVMSTMNVIVPKMVGYVDATYDPKYNDLAEQGSKKEWLDFVVTSKSHKQPTRSSMQAYRLLADKTINYCDSATGQPHYVFPDSKFCSRVKSTRRLSDHFPVMAEFEF